MHGEAVGPALRAEWGHDDARLGCRASSLFYCRTARCYMVLDLHRDRYLTFEAEPIDAAGGLAAHPLLCHAVGPPAIPRPATSVFETDVGRGHSVTLSETFRFLRCATSAAWRLRKDELQRTVAMAGQRQRERRTGTTFDFARGRVLLETFGALRPWFPRNYHCLFDSLALVDFLAAHDLFPMWVFGVQEEPFEAHCWVQAGDSVLNDSLESVSLFTPILVV